MADTKSVQDSQLAARNAEPTHLKNDAKADLGGANNSALNSVKIDAENGITTDTSIPKAVGPEPSHLKSVSENTDDDNPDMTFDDDDDVSSTDDLDEALDLAFEAVEIEVGSKKDDDDDNDDDKKDDNADDKKVVKEDETIVVKDDDKDDKKDDAKKPAPAADDKKPNPFAKKDDDKTKVASEAFKIHIKLPKGNLFESVGMSAKAQKAAGVIFETTMKDIAKQLNEQFHAHYKGLFEAKVAKHEAVLAKQVDAYLNYVVEEWVKTNKVAVRTSLRSQLSDSFLDGLQKLFKEHYVDVPESKVDLVKQLTEKVETLTKTLNEQTAKTIAVRKLAETANKARIVMDFARKNKLSEAQVAKFEKLAEDIAYTNAKEYREKLAMLKESYFTEQAKKPELTRLPEETLTEEKKDTKPASSGDPDIDFIAATLSRQAKQVW